MTALTKAELEQILEREGIREDAYSLEGGLRDERYCLDHASPEVWTVYHSERGACTQERSFNSESEACTYLYELIMSDPTTRS